MSRKQSGARGALWNLSCTKLPLNKAFSLHSFNWQERSNSRRVGVTQTLDGYAKSPINRFHRKTGKGKQEDWWKHQVKEEKVGGAFV